MTLYFLHVENGNGLEPDIRGETFVDDRHAIDQACRTAALIVGDELRTDRRSVTVRIYVEKGAGKKLATIEVCGGVTNGL